MKLNRWQVIRGLLYLFLDLVIISALLLFALFEVSTTFTESELRRMLIYISCAILFKIIVLASFGVYRMIINNFGIFESLKIMVISCATSLIVYFPMFLVPSLYHFMLSTYFFIFVIEAFGLASARYAPRILHILLAKKGSAAKAKRTLVIGAGAGGKLVLDESRTNLKLNNKIVVFIDDDPNKIGGIFSNIPVVGPVSKIGEYIDIYRIEEVIIAIADFDKASLFGIIQLLGNKDVKIKRLPLMSEIEKGKERHIVDVDINELLGRESVTLDNQEIHDFIKGKKVLVTGAGGSIGSELVRQIFKFRPSEIVLFDIYENGVYDVQQELVREIRKLSIFDTKITTLIGSTYNEERVEQIFRIFRPEIVFHAAAYKHVPLMEDSPMEAIRSNIIGTYNVANMADKYEAQKMVLVSTDKAVRPTNVMGATKSFAEMIICHFASVSQKTNYAAVRFGNVLGSNGSVIPLFKKQIEEGGPVTVTDPNINRFFMTISEAVGLILQCGVYASEGEIFILDMGKPVRIVELAEKMIRQAGYIPYKEMKIEFVGLRPGEKLYEELLLDLSHQTRTKNNKIFIEERKKTHPIQEDMLFLSKAFLLDDNKEIKRLIASVIKDYSGAQSKQKA